jgi:hypothetical protein
MPVVAILALLAGPVMGEAPQGGTLLLAPQG